MSNIPFGYLILVLFLSWCTYYVLAPFHWPRALHSFGTFFDLYNEVPFLILSWLILSTYLAFKEGDIAHPVGKLAFGLALGVGVGLLVIIYWGFQATPSVNLALDKSLRKDWRASLPVKINKSLQKNFSLKALGGPFFIRRFDVKRIANIRYGDAGERNLLDVYHPRSSTQRSPVFIHLHGGSFTSGRKNTQSLPLLYELAGNGWVCISTNYRLGPEGKFPDHIIDIKKVIAWVHEHGEEYGADPSTIFLAGNSAGAHIAAMVALTPNDPQFQPGFETVDTTITAVICQGGYYGTVATTLAIPSSPMDYSGKDAPPFFIVHGDRDRVVPIEQARRFANELQRETSNPVVYAELPYATHTFDLFHSLRSEAVLHGIQAFSTYILNNPDRLTRDRSEK